MEEIWKDIKGYEGKYQVSNLGRIRSIKRKVKNNKGSYIQEMKILKVGTGKQGYKIIGLRKDCKQTTYLLHRLVAQTFISNPENRPQVNHIDGNKENNCVTNLEWVTQSENIKHSYDIGLRDARKGTITERDMKILELLTQLRFMTVKQIQDTIFSNKSPSVYYKRLDHLTKCKLIKRKYYNLEEKSNAYVYYLDKAPKKKNLRHELLISQFYVELKKLNYEILSFEKTPIFNGFIPDAIVEFKTDKNQVKKVFLEVQLSKHSIYEKYFNINQTNDDAIPKYLWVVTDQEQQQHQIRNLRIIVDDLKMTKLKNYFN